jgi:hypothetical protein
MKNCPRCKLKALKAVGFTNNLPNLYECSNCYFCLIEKDSLVRDQAWIKLEGGTLSWLLDKKICRFNSKMSTINLPWLPYNITWKKLKPLLIFA